MNSWLPDISILLVLFGLIGALFQMHRIPLRSEVTGAGLEPRFAPRGPALPVPAMLIRQAGFIPTDIAGLYWTIKLACALLLPLILFSVTDTSGALVLIGSATVGLFTPDLYLLLRRRQRRSDISRQLGFFVSLIRVYVSTGSDLTGAFRLAAEHGLRPGGPLHRETLLVADELDSGKDRLDALADLGKRCGVPDLNHVVAVLRAGLSAGAPVSDTLLSQESLLRERLEQENTKIVNRKSMEAMLPMLLVSLPMFLVLIFFPAALQLMEILVYIKELF